MAITSISQKKLVRIFKDIKRLRSTETRFCFLLGAGASKSSGIPTGWELSKQWYDTLKEDLEESEIHEWEKWEKKVKFDVDKLGEFYTQLYEKRFEANPELGYEEFKSLMENKEPSIGYVILSQILANERHNFVITTNFDYLIEDAVRMYTDTKPFSAGHETLAGFISSQTERPTIIKVHRDLFLNPINDSKGTTILKEEWKEALRPILRNFSLLVIGYGGNDGSLMDYLTHINPEERKPIYWCKRKTDDINNKIKNLLGEKDIIVNIDDFDGLMYELFGALEYTTFKGLKESDHPFIQNAIRRNEHLEEKITELVKRTNDHSVKRLKSILADDSLILYDILSEKDIDKRKQKYKVNIDLYPESDSIINSYANFLEKELNDYKNADKYFKKAISLKPNNTTYIANYAIFLKRNLKDYIKAEEYYLKALDINPELPTTMGNYAIFLKDIKQDYDKAEELYKKAISINPNHANNIGNYALFLKDIRQDYDEAEEYYKKAILINPNHLNNVGNYAIFLHVVRKDYDKAEKYYKKAIEINPKQAIFSGNYAQLLLINGRKDEAKTYIDKAFEANNDEKKDLTLELWFYKYAHYPKLMKEAEKKIEELLKDGFKSPDWDLKENVRVAIQDKHPNPEKLQDFQVRITNLY